MTDLLPAVELETGGRVTHSVIWLHGLGADGNDFVPAVPELDVGEGFRFVFPHAPVRAVTINGGMRMRAWFDLKDLDLRHGVEVGELHASRDAVLALVAREEQRGVPRGRVALAGFSQGGAVALSAALALGRPLAGAIGLSTWLPPAAGEAGGEVAGLPVFVAHGRRDPLIPAAFGQDTARRLEALGCDVTWHEYPIEHAVNLAELRDVGAFLAACAAAS